jgi:hypothetical protein
MTEFGVPAYDTLLFDGTDLQSVSGVSVTDWSGLAAPGIRRGSHDTVPGRPGQVGARLPYDAYNFGVPVMLHAASNFARLAVLKALTAALAGTDGLGTLEWRQDDGAGGYVSLTAAGQFTALNGFALLRPDTATTELTFTNLDGAWKTAGDDWVLA